MDKPKWLALGYSVPTDTSKARVYVWRALKKIGAQSFKQSFAVLPNTQKNHIAFNSLSEKIFELSGEAFVIEFNFTSKQEDDAMTEKFKQLAIEECEKLASEVNMLKNKLESGDDDTELVDSKLRKLQKEFRLKLETTDFEVSHAVSDIRDSISRLYREMIGVRDIWYKMIAEKQKISE